MKFASGYRRLGVLTVALGIGVSTPAPWLVAALNPGPSTQDIDVWLTAGANIDISIWGVDVWHQGNAQAASVFGDMAIAVGDGSTAQAGSDVTGGFGDFAYANGAGSDASAVGSFSSATADGAEDHATTYSGLFNSASVSGTDSSVGAGVGNGDIAQVFGNDSTALAGGVGGDTAYNSDYAGAFGDHLAATATGASNLFIVEPSSHAADAVTATTDDFGLSGLLHDLGLGALVPDLDWLLGLF